MEKLEETFEQPSKSIAKVLNEAANLYDLKQLSFNPGIEAVARKLSNTLVLKNDKLVQAMTNAINTWSANEKHLTVSIENSLKEISGIYSQSANDLAQAALESLDLHKISLTATRSMQSIEQSINLYSDSAIAHITECCTELFKNIELPGSPLFGIADFAFQTISSEGQIEEEKDEISTHTLAKALKEEDNNPNEFKEKFTKKSEKWRNAYTFFKRIIITILMNIIAQLSLEAIGKVGNSVVTNFQCIMKESPEKNGEVIGDIPKGTEAMIIDDENYYYKIYFTDENGEEKEGYVAKRNVEIVEENECPND